MTIQHPLFPNSKQEPFLLTSPPSPFYNCIAWAYGDHSRCYWPDGHFYWPDDIPREEKVENFIKLFEKIGYEICNDGSLEKGFEKVAIYVSPAGKPTHAARQLPNGFWTSKLGPQHDVAHTIFAMENGYYGKVNNYLKRKK